MLGGVLLATEWFGQRQAVLNYYESLFYSELEIKSHKHRRYVESILSVTVYDLGNWDIDMDHIIEER